MIIIKLKTVIKRLPIKVTVHNGILSKNPQSSTAVMISCGNTVSCTFPNPAASMMVLTTPCMIRNNAIINSRP